jgi:hypothetical protein
MSSQVTPHTKRLAFAKTLLFGLRSILQSCETEDFTLSELIEKIHLEAEADELGSLVFYYEEALEHEEPEIQEVSWEHVKTKILAIRTLVDSGVEGR